MPQSFQVYLKSFLASLEQTLIGSINYLIRWKKKHFKNDSNLLHLSKFLVLLPQCLVWNLLCLEAVVEIKIWASVQSRSLKFPFAEDPTHRSEVPLRSLHLFYCHVWTTVAKYSSTLNRISRKILLSYSVLNCLQTFRFQSSEQARTN